MSLNWKFYMAEWKKERECVSAILCSGRSLVSIHTYIHKKRRPT